MQRIMLDLETMGNSPTAAITSIGAVKFDGDRILGGFYQVVNLKSCTDMGLTIDPGTVIWWMQQSDEARSIYGRSSNAKDLAHVLQNFAGWMEDKQTEIWGNGSDFDNVVLFSAYQKCGISPPWHFRDNRCYRTMKNIYKNIKFKRIGTGHNAFDDAKSQAAHLIEILNYIGKLGE